MNKWKDTAWIKDNKKAMLATTEKVHIDLKEQKEDVLKRKVARWEKNMKIFEGKPVYNPNIKNEDGTFGATEIYKNKK